MPDDPERYVTVAELEEELPFAEEAFDFDNWTAALERFLDEESGRIEQQDYAGTVFTETETTQTLNGDESTVGADLLLPDRPVVSVASIDADGETLDVEADIRVRDTHLELLDGATIDDWPDGPIEVTWTFGYDAVPTDIRDAVVRLVRSRIERIQSDGLESESLPSGQSASYRPPEDVTSAVQRTVLQHRPPSYYSGITVI